MYIEKYLLLISVILALLFSINSQTDFRAGDRFKFNLKNRVKKNSILRKILPFKESEENPLLYVKVIPVLIYIILFILVLIIYIISCLFSIMYLDEFLSSRLCVIISIIIILSSLIYSGFMQI